MLDDKNTKTTFKIVNENAEFSRIANDYIIKKFNYIDDSYAKTLAKIMLKKYKYTKEQIFEGLADFSIYDEIDKDIFEELAKYIQERFTPKMDYLEAKAIGKKVVKRDGFSKEEVLSGVADRNIIIRLKKEKTVQKKDEPVVKVILKTIKEKVDAKFVAKALATFMLLSAMYGFVIEPTIEELKENQEITQSIGMLAAEPDSYEYIHRQSIVSQNTYLVPGQLDEQGFPIIAYYNDKIASDILQVCSKDPELFDLCMHNVYFNMNYNKLSNMDEVVRFLQIYSSDAQSLEFIQEKLANCENFLDYLISRGFADPNSEDYYKLLEDINNYENLKGEYDISFNALPKESQDRIMKLIEAFKDNKNNLYDEYKDNLEEVKGDNYGTRSKCNKVRR